MTKERYQLEKTIVEETKLSLPETQKITKALYQTITEEMSKGGKVVVPQLGTFTVNKIRSRPVYNLRDPKRKLLILEKLSPTFRSSHVIRRKIREANPIEVPHPPSSKTTGDARAKVPKGAIPIPIKVTKLSPLPQAREPVTRFLLDSDKDPASRLLRSALKEARKNGGQGLEFSPVGEDLAIYAIKNKIPSTIGAIPSQWKKKFFLFAQHLADLKEKDLFKKVGRFRLALSPSSEPLEGKIIFFPAKSAGELKVNFIFQSLEEIPLLEKFIGPHLPRFRQALEGNGLVVLLNEKTAPARPFSYSILNDPTGVGKKLSLEEEILQLLPDVIQVSFEENPDLEWGGALESAHIYNPKSLLIAPATEVMEILKSEANQRLVLGEFPGNNTLSFLKMFPHLQTAPEHALVNLKAIAKVKPHPRLCPYCRQKYTPSPRERFSLERILSPLRVRNISLWQAKGCSHCDNTGSQGETFLTELLFPSRALKEMSLDEASPFVLSRQAEKEGFITLPQDAILKANQGLISFETLRNEVLV